MRYLLLTALLLLAAVVATPVRAQGFVSEGVAPFLALVDELDIDVADGVKDGCWPRPNATKDAVELAIRRAGIKVLDESFSASLEISANGFVVVADSCAVHVSLELYFWTAVNMPFHGAETKTVSPILVAKKGVMLTWSKGYMQRKVTDVTLEMLTSIMLDIVKAREDMTAKYPKFKEGFERSSQGD